MSPEKLEFARWLLVVVLLFVVLARQGTIRSQLFDIQANQELTQEQADTIEDGVHAVEDTTRLYEVSTPTEKT